MPIACVVMKASGSEIERSTCVSAAKLTTASTAATAASTGVGVLDPRVDEPEARVVAQVGEVLLAPGVRELVEHGDLVTELLQALAGEVRADEAGPSADEQLHAVTVSSR